MENICNILATNIQTYRKKSGMTQEELANKLGVSFQAVSKWENAKSLPDILFLPVLADLFNCNIDELFSRKSEPNVNNEYCTELPGRTMALFVVWFAKVEKFYKKQTT